VSASPSAVAAERAVAVALRATGITKVHDRGPGAVTALDDVSVAFERGRFAAVMGPSGSGKSTLLHCLAGLDAVDAGTVHLGDVELTALGERERTRVRRDRIGVVFQSHNLLPTLTVRENLLLPLTIAGRAPDSAWLDRLLDAVSLRDLVDHPPAHLSGGERQRVAVARALVGRPTVVLADEPTGNLDARSGEALLRLLRRSVDELGQTVVMVTHDPVAAGHADEAVFLADGRVVDRMRAPTARAVLDRMKTLGA
jgi:putative ABC transport system ATP-binding protein